MQMTMAVGFLCRDGVVIGADRQITAQEKYTFPECKLTATRWRNGHGILGYAGNHDTYRAFEKLFMSAFSGDVVIARDDVASRLEEVLKAIIRKKEGFQTLFGFWVDGKYQSLLTSVGSDRVLDVDECEVIGHGDSPLSRFLLGTFKDVPHYVTVHQARIYAVYFISQAKKYDGQYVGGPIDVYSIDMSGQNGERCVRVLDAGRTPEWEEQTNRIRYWMDVIFSQLTNKDNPVSVEQFNERMSQFRDWCAPWESEAERDAPPIVLFPPMGK
jgi:hypothetical protein